MGVKPRSEPGLNGSIKLHKLFEDKPRGPCILLVGSDNIGLFAPGAILAALW